MKAYIQGAGVVGGVGHGLASLEEALGRLPSGASATAADREPAASSLMAATDDLERFVPARALRRVDHYTRMAALASHLALEDADLKGGLPEHTGLVVATGMGPTANTLDLQSPDAGADELALSPIQFSNSVQNAAAAYISMILKIRGPCLSLAHYEMAVPLAFQTAVDWLAEGRTETVLVGSIDCFSQALHAAYLECLNRQGAGRGRQRVPVGEGSTFFILTRSQARGTRCPFVEQVHLAGTGRPDGAAIPHSLILRNGAGPHGGFADQSPAHANLAHLYGDFPTSMGMDVAAALLLLRKERLLGTALPQFEGGPAFHEYPRIGCLKQGESGDWGLIVVAR